MKHYAHNISEIQQNVDHIFSLLTESRNDEKAVIIKLIERLKGQIVTLKTDLCARESRLKIDQQMFCDELKIEFSTNEDFSDSYIRNYSAMVVDCETLKTLIFGERQLQNMSDEMLFARVTILDTDPNA